MFQSEVKQIIYKVLYLPCKALGIKNIHISLLDHQVV
jgi:hypothetical protein